MKAVERAKEEGLEVVAIVTLVDREEGAREAIEGAGQVLRAVFTKSEIVGALSRQKPIWICIKKWPAELSLPASVRFIWFLSKLRNTEFFRFCPSGEQAHRGARCQLLV